MVIAANLPDLFANSPEGVFPTDPFSGLALALHGVLEPVGRREQVVLFQALWTPTTAGGRMIDVRPYGYYAVVLNVSFQLAQRFTDAAAGVMG